MRAYSITRKVDSMVKKVATTATVIMVMFWTMIGVPMSVFAVDAASEACDSIKLLDSSAGCDDPAVAEKGFTKIIRVIINTLSVVVGAISVIVIIVGGFRYVTSGGDSNATKGAKDTIMYAVIGLVVAIFAQVIIVFVLSKL